MRLNYPYTFAAFMCALLLPLITQAQEETKVHWGLAAPISGKLRILSSQGNAYSVWGSAGICLTQVIEGTEENALSLLNKAGFMLDFTRYPVMTFKGKLLINRGNLFINPEILFPLAIRRLKISAGIGVEYNGYFLAQLDQETTTAAGITAYEKINDARRKIFPFVSAGLLYAINKEFSLQLFIRQVLLNYFDEATKLYLRASATEPDVILYERPTYLGLSFSYYFN